MDEITRTEYRLLQEVLDKLVGKGVVQKHVMNNGMDVLYTDGKVKLLRDLNGVCLKDKKAIKAFVKKYGG